ncbi:hypothetical protein SXCC_00331 [Gluconacetobacter sp. SXCC-1]|nr:hypothetical protein SXCC_00331 [Gluconacetobacter sp. SXCC-1]
MYCQTHGHTTELIWAYPNIDRSTRCNGRFMSKLSVLHVDGNGNFVPRTVYRPSPNNVGFWATAITTSMSASRRKPTWGHTLHPRHSIMRRYRPATP